MILTTVFCFVGGVILATIGTIKLELYNRPSVRMFIYLMGILLIAVSASSN